MARGEDVSAAGTQRGHAIEHRGSTSSGVPNGSVLCVHIPPWKHEPVAEIPLQRRRLHALGRHLDRVENVDAQRDQVGNQGPGSRRNCAS